MLLPKEYFSLQLEFTDRVQAITQKKLEDVLIEYTSFYKASHIDNWHFNPQDPVWMEFLSKFNQADDKLETVYSFCKDNIADQPDEHFFGCFRYDYESKENYIQLHFKNKDESGLGPLSSQRISVRLAELTEMFKDINKNYPQVVSVSGFSWLYNIDVYKRLFPLEYIATAKVVSGWFKTGALWHQFVDSGFNMKADLVDKFRNCIKTKNSIQELEECFPYRILELDVDIQYFYKFYMI